MTEFDLIKRYFSRPSKSALLGVGDDAALLQLTPGQTLAVSCDMLVEGRHFLPDVDPRTLGHKALAVNLSDMAAMGARPRWATLAIALPRVDETWLGEFAAGFFALADEHEVELIGGDTTAGPLNICVQIMGEVAADQALRRDGARVGDSVWVSGTLGDAATGLALLQGRLQLAEADAAFARQRLQQPWPRVALGLALRGIAHSAIDVSDGLLADLGHICQRSAVAARIELAQLPRSSLLASLPDQALARDAVLAGGDDYELCFTAPASAHDRLTALARQLALPLTEIGVIVAGAGVQVLDADGRPVTARRSGFDHFA